MRPIACHQSAPHIPGHHTSIAICCAHASCCCSHSGLLLDPGLSSANTVAHPCACPCTDNILAHPLLLLQLCVWRHPAFSGMLTSHQAPTAGLCHVRNAVVTLQSCQGEPLPPPQPHSTCLLLWHHRSCSCGLYPHSTHTPALQTAGSCCLLSCQLTEADRILPAQTSTDHR